LAGDALLTLLRQFTALSRPLIGFKGPTSKGRDGREGKREGRGKREGKEGVRKGREVRLPHSEFLDPPLGTCCQFRCVYAPVKPHLLAGE